MRRRVLFGEGVLNLTLSKSSATVSAMSGSTSFVLYNNGKAFKRDGVSVSSTNTSVATASYNSSNGVITVNYSKNTSLTSQRFATIVVSYKTTSLNFSLTQQAYSGKERGTAGNLLDVLFVNNSDTSRMGLFSSSEWPSSSSWTPIGIVVVPRRASSLWR